MRHAVEGVAAKLRLRSRAVALAILCRLRRDRTIARTEAWFDTLPRRRQAAAVRAAVVLLLVLALIAAQFGWPGLLVYFLAAIWLAG
jgi:hypothetical protein